jgi:hypothetical protein
MYTCPSPVFMDGWELQPLQYPEDEIGYSPRNVGIFAIQPLDAVGSPRRFVLYLVAVKAPDHGHCKDASLSQTLKFDMYV